MRSLAICLILILEACAAAVGQNPVPQWKVVQAISVLQNAPIPPTTIFTPTQPGSYRLSGYLSLKPENNETEFVNANFYWTDASHHLAGASMQVPVGCSKCPLWTSMVPVMFKPLPGVPVNYYTTVTGVGTGQYDLVFTIEQLQ